MMELRILSLKMTNFKGFKEIEYFFDGKTSIVKGSNGLGKTTMATAFYWVMSDKDYDLVSNPNIRPINVEECTPRVDIVMDIDGKTVTLSKQQKRKVSDANGITKVAITNSYEVNAVPKSEKAFKEYLVECGIDTDKFLELSHPDVFVSNMNDKKGKEHMKNVLFAMGKKLSDKDIAEKLGAKASETNELLNNYSLDEIDAIQSQTLRKIKEDYGKDGEILNSKIEGLELAKVDIDTAELELAKNDLERQLSGIRAKMDDVNSNADEYNKLSDGIIQLKMKLADMQREAHEQQVFNRADRLRSIEAKRCECDELSRKIKYAENSIAYSESRLTTLKESIKVVQAEYKTASASTFDVDTCVCPMCNQQLPEEKIAELMEDFEIKKKSTLENITKKGNNLKNEIDEIKTQIKTDSELLTELKKQSEIANEVFRELSNNKDEAEQIVDVMLTPAYKAIELEINNKEKSMETFNSFSDLKVELKGQELEIQNQIMEITSKINLANNNVNIDEKIMALRNKQSEYEQAKADAEKIKFQIDLIKRKKNELFTEEINKHFNLVSWQLFDYNKSGQYVEVCIPLIDGKRFGESTNTGREMLAKLDVIKGLQKFYGQFIPVFLDKAESLSTDTYNRIIMDNQIIYLAVTDSNELEVRN